jgi:chemotaxis response regulator CheB
MNMIKILIADDSKTATAILKSLIEAEPDMKIIGEASDGQMAVAMSAKLKPDLITMDIKRLRRDAAYYVAESHACRHHQFKHQ